MQRSAEHEESLWWLASSPVIWVVHLLACYATAAIFCARAGERETSLAPVQGAIAGYTAVALASVLWIAVRSYRRHRLGGATAPHYGDTRRDRSSFLGLATLLLSLLSAVGILFVASPALFIQSCQ